MRPRKTRRLAAIVAASVVLAGTAVGAGCAPEAQADPGLGCETIDWGFLGSQRRTICDGPVKADGNWLRTRIIWTPAHYVPGYCGGYYVLSCRAGYNVGETLQAKEPYWVNNSNVLPDEPGHLPAGTDIIR